MLVECVALACAYLIGSVSFGLVIANRKGVDLRHQGSGNTGATNVGRTVGQREGRLVLVADALKGLLPTLVASVVWGREPFVAALTGVAAVIGHCWPIWHGFRGGKGAATAAGSFLALDFPAGLVGILVYAVGKRASGKTSVGSLAGTASAVCLSVGRWAAFGGTPWFAAAGVAMGVIVWVRHRDNIARLRAGTEPSS